MKLQFYCLDYIIFKKKNIQTSKKTFSISNKFYFTPEPSKSGTNFTEAVFPSCI